MPDLTYTERAKYERELAKWIAERDRTIALPSGQTARIIESTYFPSGIVGNRAQVLLDVEPIKEAI